MNSTREAQENLGELFIMGFSGLELGAETASFIRNSRIGGIILFSPNYDSPAQAAELANEIQDCSSGLPLWIAVDHEGGRVQRFKKSFTRIPEAADIAATGSPQLAYEISSLMAHELGAVGVNLNFCPVADIHTNPKNPVIGDRAFAEKADDVARLGRTMFDPIITLQDAAGKTVAAASTLEKDARSATGATIDAATSVGKRVAERAKAAGVTSVVFDRGGFLFHGRVKALADAARRRIGVLNG